MFSSSEPAPGTLPPADNGGALSNVPSISKSAPTTLIRFMTTCCLINAAGLVFAGSMGIISILPTTIITALYVILFSLVLFVEELGLSIFQGFIVKNFGFMTSWLGRAGFLIFIGVLSFSLGTIGMIVAIVSLINAAFNIIVYKMRPDVREFLNQQAAKIRREVAQSEEAEYRISADAIMNEIALRSVQQSVAESVAASRV